MKTRKKSVSDGYSKTKQNCVQIKYKALSFKVFVQTSEAWNGRYFPVAAEGALVVAGATGAATATPPTPPVGLATPTGAGRAIPTAELTGLYGLPGLK